MQAQLTNKIIGMGLCFIYYSCGYTNYCNIITHMLVSKCAWNHILSEKYKTVQSMKLHFLQNIPLVWPYTSASDGTGVGTIPGSYYMEAFSALLLHS